MFNFCDKTLTNHHVSYTFLLLAQTSEDSCTIRATLLQELACNVKKPLTYLFQTIFGHSSRVSCPCKDGGRARKKDNLSSASDFP